MHLRHSSCKQSEKEEIFSAGGVGHEYHIRDYLFKWCKRWKEEHKWLSVDGKEGEDGYEEVERVLKKLKISLPMFLVFAEEKCSWALLDVRFITDVG